MIRMIRMTRLKHAKLLLSRAYRGYPNIRRSRSPKVIGTTKL